MQNMIQIGLMNLNIIAGKRIGDDMENPFSQVLRYGPSYPNDTNAMCPRQSVDEYIACSKEKVTWVKGMSDGERRLAFKRGDLNGTRETRNISQKHVETDENAELWFRHGLLDPKTGNLTMTQIIPG